MKNKWVPLIIIIGIAVIVLFFVFSNSNDNKITNEPNNVINPIILNTELKNINTGESFRLSDFNKPILLESFAVWCPTCTQQQKEIKKLHEEIGDDVISVSIDTDPNEDEARVLEHTERNGFNWHYSIPPIEFTRTLIDEFGINIVNAPQAPMILICNNEARKLNPGVKNVDELKRELATCNR